MMRYLLLLISMVTFWAQASAQERIMARNINQKPFIEHTIVNNQTIFTLSRLYNVSLAEIADANHALYRKGFSNNDVVLIPLTKNNYLTEPSEDAMPVHYTVANNESLMILARWLNLRQSMLQTWNDLPTPSIRNGQVLVIGWVKYTQPKENKTNTTLRDKDIVDETLANTKTTAATANETEPTALEISYLEQLSEEEQKNGLLVFYKNKMPLSKGTYHAFHNTATKGSIVKVVNPINNKSVYALVIGKIPNLNAYKDAIVVLSDNAINELDAESNTFFCNLFYK